MPHFGPQGLPAVDGTGHGDGVRAGAGHGPVALRDQFLDVGRCRGATAAVDGAHRLILLVPDQREEVAAHAGGVGFDHSQRGGGGDGGVYGIAAVHQGLQPGHSGQGLAGGDHAVGGENGAASGVKVHIRLTLTLTLSQREREFPF